MSDFTEKLRPAAPSGPDTLAKERSKSRIDDQELASHLFPDGFLERQSRVLEPMLKEKTLDKSNQQHLSRPDRYKLGLARAKTLRRLADRHGWSQRESEMAEYLVDEMSPYHLHMTMFNTTIREQGNDEQQRHWVPLIESWRIIGSYAQTELGHGSNVQGLETEARWDATKRQFVLHSPTLTASKWWPGSLGRTATHAVVVAQLMLPLSRSTGSDRLVSYGPHPFVLQIRDAKTHLPLPGIVVGDIGPKYGYASMDNGYMLFDNHVVPHSAFLSRYSQVNPASGAYSKPKNPAVVYGSLTQIRAQIVMQARLILARGVTNAIRYTSIRRQFPDRDDQGEDPKQEVAVLDYTTVQIRLLPLLATTFALHYTGVAMGKLYLSTRNQINKGDFSALADLHATSSGLKSLCTTLAADGIETCRRAMGGHGFHGGSGMVSLITNYLSKPTVEGDNWMIFQQTASYLIKKVSEALSIIEKHKLKSTEDVTEAAIISYLSRHKSASLNPVRILSNSSSLDATDADLVEAFSVRGAALAVQAHDSRINRKSSWNSLLIELRELSNAHAQTMLVRNFHAAIAAHSVPSSARLALLACYRLFALTTLSSHALSFVQTGAVSLTEVNGLPTRIRELMSELRPHAVKLVDAWSVPDYLLDSALGRYDGKVYETLFDMAHRQNPINEFIANPYWWEDELEMRKGIEGSKL